MKKLFLFTLIFVFGCSTFVLAEENEFNSKQIGILIIGGHTDFKHGKYLTAAEEIFSKNKAKNFSIVAGDKIQNVYYDFCAKKDISSEQAPKLDDLLEFTKENNFYRVLCLVVQQPDVDTYMREQELLFGSSEVLPEAIVHIQMDAYLCDENRLIKSHSSSKKRKGSYDVFSLGRLGKFTSGKAVAKATLGAFKLCTQDVSKAIFGLW